MFTLAQPDFSLFALIDPQDVSSMFEERTPMLAHWSHVLEATVLDQQLVAEMGVGSQKMRRLVPHLPQYLHLSEVTRALTIFGLPDAEVIESSLPCVTLSPGDALSREWFVIVKHPAYSRALIAREIDKTSRTFQGILTSDPAHVEYFYEALMTTIQQKA